MFFSKKITVESFAYGITLDLQEVDGSLTYTKKKNGQIRTLPCSTPFVVSW